MKPTVRAAVLLAAAFAAPTLAFDLQGHRGARGLAPENTLAAFATALAIGVTTLETDLAVTRDGVVVIAHDPDLNPALARVDGAWLKERGPPIRSLSLAELARYDVGRTDPASPYGRQWPEQAARDGERIPTLAALFELAGTAARPVRFNLETKITPTSGATTLGADAFAEVVVEAVRKAGLSSRTTLQSFDWPASPRPATTVRCRGWRAPPAARSGRRTSAASRASASPKPTHSAFGCCRGRSTIRRPWRG